jgi:hypothetical protein
VSQPLEEIKQNHYLRNLLGYFFPSATRLLDSGFFFTVKFMELTQERLKELFNYNPDTGIFTRKCNKGKALKSNTVGNISNSTGYIYIKIDYKLYSAHSLVFLYMLGKFSDGIIDHIDMNKLNNRFSNLRECSVSQNGFNAKCRRDNKLGIKGLAYVRANNQYQARITMNKRVYRKSYDVAKYGNDLAKNLAITWLEEQRKILHGEFTNHG